MNNDAHPGDNNLNHFMKTSYTRSSVSSHSHFATRHAVRVTGAPRHFSGQPSNIHREPYSITRASDGRDARVRRGCYNYGEFNHRHAQCRFDYKLRCQACRQLGHKSRLCEIYSTY